MRKVKVICPNGHEFSASMKMVGGTKCFFMTVEGKKRMMWLHCPTCRKKLREKDEPQDPNETVKV